MKGKKLMKVMMVCINVLLLNGCWDRKELNDRALLLGWGVDLAEDGSYIGSAQIIKPTRTTEGSQAGKELGFFVVSGKGKNITDSNTADIQNKLSRQVFAGQRRDIFIGERLAKNGLSKAVDEYSRNPDVRLRTDIFVVKGNTAEALLKLSYPLEKIPAIAAFKIHENTGGPVNETLAHFLIALNSDGASPVLPAVEIIHSDGQKENDKPRIKFCGLAVFDRALKLLGYLNLSERTNKDWVSGLLKESSFTAFVPENDGYVSAQTSHFKSKLMPQLDGDKIKMNIQLSAIGIVKENDGTLDLRESKNLTIIENALNKSKEKEILDLIHRVQDKYGTDIFGFSDELHMKYPYQWKQLKSSWEQEFKKIEVNVDVKIKIKQAGLSGKPTHLKEGD